MTKKTKRHKCDECGKLTTNESGLCDECESEGEPQDWEFDAYGEECWCD